MTDNPRQQIERWRDEVLPARQQVAETLKGRMFQSAAMGELGELSPGQVEAARRAYEDALDKVDAAEATIGLLEKRAEEQEANAPKIEQQLEAISDLKAAMAEHIATTRQGATTMEEGDHGSTTAASAIRAAASVLPGLGYDGPDPLADIPLPHEAVTLPEDIALRYAPQSFCQAMAVVQARDTLRNRLAILFDQSSIPGRAQQIQNISAALDRADRIVSALASRADLSFLDSGPSGTPDFVAGESGTLVAPGSAQATPIGQGGAFVPAQ